MQTVVYIIAKSSIRRSLRDAINDDPRISDSELQIEFEKKNNRAGGWTKIKAKGLCGVINLTWDAHSKTLIARAIAKQGNNPGPLVGRFVAYIIEHHRDKVVGVTIRPS